MKALIKSFNQLIVVNRWLKEIEVVDAFIEVELIDISYKLLFGLVKFKKNIYFRNSP